MHQARGGIGSHKHGISGYPNVSRWMKMWMERAENAARAHRAKSRQTMYPTIKEAMDAAHADMKAKRT